MAHTDRGDKRTISAWAQQMHPVLDVGGGGVFCAHTLRILTRSPVRRRRGRRNRSLTGTAAAATSRTESGGGRARQPILKRKPSTAVAAAAVLESGGRCSYSLDPIPSIITAMAATLVLRRSSGAHSTAVLGKWQAGQPKRVKSKGTYLILTPGVAVVRAWQVPGTMGWPRYTRVGLR